MLFCCMSSLRKAPAACSTEEIRSRAFTVALLAVAMKRGFLDTNWDTRYNADKNRFETMVFFVEKKEGKSYREMWLPIDTVSEGVVETLKL